MEGCCVKIQRILIRAQLLDPFVVFLLSLLLSPLLLLLPATPRLSHYDESEGAIQRGRRREEGGKEKGGVRGYWLAQSMTSWALSLSCVYSVSLVSVLCVQAYVYGKCCLVPFILCYSELHLSNLIPYSFFSSCFHAGVTLIKLITHTIFQRFDFSHPFLPLDGAELNSQSSAMSTLHFSLASVFFSLTVIVTRALCQTEDESCLWKDKEPWQSKADTLQEKLPHLTASDQSHFSSDQDYRVYEFTESANFVNNNVSTTTSLLYRQYCGLTPWVAVFRMCLGSTEFHPNTFTGRGQGLCR